MGEIRLLGITEMKISAALLAATCSAEWTKPSYYDFIYKDQGQMRASGMANWGHPVVGSTRHWSDCPTLDVPEGALGLRCNAGTCALLCPGGSRATGRRRVRCRYTKKLGWYWKSKLGKCQTCDVETPMSNDGLMTTACKVNVNTGRKFCKMVCPADMAAADRPTSFVKVACSAQNKVQRVANGTTDSELPIMKTTNVMLRLFQPILVTAKTLMVIIHMLLVLEVELELEITMIQLSSQQVHQLVTQQVLQQVHRQQMQVQIHMHQVAHQVALLQVQGELRRQLWHHMEVELVTVLELVQALVPQPQQHLQRQVLQHQPLLQPRPQQQLLLQPQQQHQLQPQQQHRLQP